MMKRAVGFASQTIERGLNPLFAGNPNGDESGLFGVAREIGVGAEALGPALIAQA